MRPRHKAAENALLPRSIADTPGGASMRPRHKAAENPASPGTATRGWRASMRPRHKAAENLESRSIRPGYEAALQ